MLPNAEIREQALARRFVVSKSPVREALLRLEQERLVTVAPRQGYKVAPISVDDAREMFGLRRVLEAACVEASAGDPLAPLVQALDAFRTLSLGKGEDRTEAFIRYNRAFHSAICYSSGNARMARIGVDLIEQMERMIRFSVAAVPPEEKGVLLQEHGEIIDAIQAGNRRTAARLVKQHILEAEKRVIGGLSSAAVHL